MSERVVPVAALEAVADTELDDDISEKVRQALRLALSKMRDEEIADLAAMVARLRGESPRDDAPTEGPARLSGSQPKGL